MADWRPMTDDERRACLALSTSRVTYPVASSPKRLARSLAAQAAAAEPVITDKQASCIWPLVYRFRRQIPTDIVQMAMARGFGNPLRAGD